MGGAEKAMNIRWIKAAGIVAALSATPVEAAEYRMLTSWDKSNPAIALLAEAFAKNVEAASKGNIKFVLNGPETVPPFEQLQPVASGAFHLLYTVGIYHYGTTGVAVALDAIRGTMDERRASGLFAAIDQHYQTLGLKVVAVPISATKGYHFVLKAPVGAGGDFSGRKIRGTPAYHPVIRMLGGTPVVLPPAEIYSGLEKGVIDGAAWPAVGVLGTRWYEVAKYLARPGFGVAHQIFLMNLDTWNRFSADEKAMMLAEGRKLEDVWYKEFDRMAEEEEKALIARGMTITRLSASEAKLNQVWGEGLWDLVVKKNPKEAEQLRKLARSKNLTD